jgi:hypothetical protein
MINIFKYIFLKLYFTLYTLHFTLHFLMIFQLNFTLSFLFFKTVFSALVTSPNNIICFPERDFCNFENFIDNTGQTLLVEVNRNGAVVGSATGIVSGNIVAFEINHPGGRCWGDGTTLKVTPDIQAGDLVTVKSGSLLLGDSIVQNGYISTYDLVGTTLTIKGFVASTVIPGNIEVRVVNPLLLGTTVQKRQVNAAFGPLTPNVGYTSGLEVVGTSFTATFIFNIQEAANIAGSGEGFSMRMWQETAANGARQGLTISEYGEVGGPFGSLCPGGPQNIGSPVAHAVAVSGNLIKWSPGQDIIGAPATTEFSINVLRGNQVYGYRVPKTELQVTFDLTPLTGGDIIELRSMIGTKMSDSFLMTYQPQDIIPTINTIPVNDPVTEVQTELVILQSNTNQIVYTLDGSAVLDVNNKISPSAILYYTPIHVTSSITVRAVSFDRAGKFSAELLGKFAPLAVVPQTITIAPTTVVENGVITVSWIKPNDQSISGFGVEIFTLDGVKVGITRIVSATFITVTDLVPGTSYQFSVMTQNVGAFSVASPKTAPVVFPSPTDIIVITTARYTVNKRFRITGTGNVAATVTLYSANEDKSIGSIIFNRGTTVPISAQVICTETCSFTIDIRNGNVPLVRPSEIYVRSSRGGVSGPFTVI